jgi:hypothetical protein
VSDFQTPPPDDVPLLPHSEGAVYQVEEVEPRPTRKGCLWGIGGAAGCLLLLLVIPVTLVLLGVTSFGGLVGGLGSLFGLNAPTTANVISTQTIVQGIQPLGQLVSVSAQVAKADVPGST